MIRIFLLFLAFAIADISLCAQSCLPEGIKFTTQQQVDDFAVDYPGCTIIEGNVCIGGCGTGTSDITNLQGLSQLTQILGGLNFSGNPLLENLDGLENIDEVGGNMDFNSNPNLTNLSGLAGLQQIGGVLRFIDAKADPGDLTGLERIGGSYWFYGNSPITDFQGNANLRYIGGDLNVTTDGLTHLSGFENLDTIVGFLWIHGRNLIEVSPFQNLTYAGAIQISDAYYLEQFPDFPALQYLGDFNVSYNIELQILPQFPLLEEVDGNFLIVHNEKLRDILGYDNIRRVKGTFSITDWTGESPIRSGIEPYVIKGFSQLHFVGGDFEIGILIHRVDTMEAFAQLDTIGGGFTAVANPFRYHTFPQSNAFGFIGGRIELNKLSQLKDLRCFQYLDTIDGDFILHGLDSLTSLTGMEKLSNINGRIDFTDIQVANMQPFQQLKTISGGLLIYDLDLLVTLEGLEQLQSMHGQLLFEGNGQLTSLDGIRNIDPEGFQFSVGKDIVLKNNPQLSFCHTSNICFALTELRKKYTISNNAPGCLVIQDLECGPGFGLQGNVYYDANENKMQDADEPGIPYVRMVFQPGDESAITSPSGRYLKFAREDSVYTFYPDIGPDWKITTDSLQYTRTFTQGAPSNLGNDFGLYPLVDMNDFEVNLSSLATRCNASVKFILRAVNEGIHAVDGEIRLSYDPLVEYLASDPVPDSVNLPAHELIWEMDSFPAFGSQDILLLFRMPGEFYLGTVMDFDVEAWVDSVDQLVLRDHYDYGPKLICAVDPNDKIVIPSGDRMQNYTAKRDVLTYTVRFENQGNAEAINITIRDTIDQAFDMSSLRVMNSSYPVFTSIQKNVVTFFFKNIWLPANGNGFVTYEISPLADTPDFTVVENKADIVFDFNQPILTNETQNTLVESLCQDVFVSMDTTICAGQEFMGWDESGTYEHTVPFGSYCDSVTTVTLHVLPPDVITLDTFICEGYDFLGLTTPGVYTYDTLNSVTGCLENLVILLEVIPTGDPGCITATHSPSLQSVYVYPNPAKDFVEIRSVDDIEGIEMLDAMGQSVLLDVAMKSKPKFIDISALPEGMYFLNVYFNDANAIVKFIKGSDR